MKSMNTFSTVNLLLIFFILTLTPIVINAEKVFAVGEEGQNESDLKTISERGKNYIALDEIANKLYAKADYKKDRFSITNLGKELRFSPGSYFAAYENPSGTKTFQMREVPIMRGDELYIPMNSFLISIEILNLGIVKEEGGAYKIRTEAARDDVSNDVVLNEPNVYLLPPDLDKSGLKEFEDKNSNKKYGQESASNDTRTEKKNNNSRLIEQIFTVIKDGQYELHLRGNVVIEEYHKPECSGTELLIRIPYFKDGTDNSKSGNIDNLIKSVTSEKIRHFLVYKINFSNDIIKCSSLRRGPKEIAFFLTFKNVDLNEVNRNKVSARVDEKQSMRSVDKEKMTEAVPKEIAPKESVSMKTDSKEIVSKDKWALDCIVLDPGHGGKDAGAVGVGGTYEKDITLKLAHKVRDILAKETPSIKVVLTRNEDRFIELYKRGQIANKAGGKLFISIHLNSARKKPSPASGLETYILSPGKNEDAIRVANFENSVIQFEEQTNRYKKLNEEEIIIATMAQSAFVRLSELFARLIQQEVINLTSFEDRGVKQAGFYVLIGASMPNVLFEAGFLSNREEEKYLKSEAGQDKIARGIVNAIKKYADEYKKY